VVKALGKEPPDSPKTWRNVDRWPDAAAKNRAYAVYEALDALVPETYGAFVPDDGAVQSVVVPQRTGPSLLSFDRYPTT
jgi:hypothetical protein